MRFSISLYLLLLPFFVFANEEPTEWTLYTSDNGVEVYYKYAPCDLEMGFDYEWVLLKFVNTTITNKLVDFDKVMEIDGDCVTCNDPEGEYHMTIAINAMETIEGSCTVYDEASHHIFSKIITPNTGIDDQLTGFDLGNFTVTNNE